MKRGIALLFTILACACGMGRLDLIPKYEGVSPTQWSENATGVRTRIRTNEKILALTMDACGSQGDSLDEDLISFLIQEQIPTTVFITGRWIDKYPDRFKRLAENPLFEIENHGLNHRPASLTGRSIYGITGTENAQALIQEVADNADKIEKLTGRRPIFFRSGTAYYDEEAVKLIQDMGFQSIGFSVLGDKGATYTASEVVNAFLRSRAGDIIICHMNHPEKETGQGIRQALPILKKQGYRFVHLKDYQDLLY
ncbi:MAG: polysaccharide deacetylase family protein [Pseudomonadota bacterium]|nr:polysaccharide deacetylase family protein [Pseudomonadota bacterium]